jgi:hypothetical protein
MQAGESSLFTYFSHNATGNGVMKASMKRFAKMQGTAPRPGEAGAQGESSEEGEGKYMCRKLQQTKHIWYHTHPIAVDLLIWSDIRGFVGCGIE